MAYVVAGSLADRIFEPLMAADGLLAGSVGQILGVGPGRYWLAIYYDGNYSDSGDSCRLPISAVVVCRTRIARCYLGLGESSGVSVLFPGGRSLFLGLWY